jgi:hypothetical protein
MMTKRSVPSTTVAGRFENVRSRGERAACGWSDELAGCLGRFPQLAHARGLSRQPLTEVVEPALRGRGGAATPDTRSTVTAIIPPPRPSTPS